jgi:hypothetical protein
MLHRILGVLLLGTGLLLANVPGQACARAVPMDRCCPSDPAQPCPALGSNGFGVAMATVDCCAAGVPAAPVAALALSATSEIRVVSADPPLVAVAFNAFPPREFTAPALERFTPRWSPSGSALYLSTLRLRL